MIGPKTTIGDRHENHRTQRILIYLVHTVYRPETIAHREPIDTIYLMTSNPLEYIVGKDRFRFLIQIGLKLNEVDWKLVGSLLMIYQFVLRIISQ